MLSASHRDARVKREDRRDCCAAASAELVLAKHRNRRRAVYLLPAEDNTLWNQTARDEHEDDAFAFGSNFGLLLRGVRRRTDQQSGAGATHDKPPN